MIEKKMSISSRFDTPLTPRCSQTQRFCLPFLIMDGTRDQLRVCVKVYIKNKHLKSILKICYWKILKIESVTWHFSRKKSTRKKSDFRWAWYLGTGSSKIKKQKMFYYFESLSRPCRRVFLINLIVKNVVIVWSRKSYSRRKSFSRKRV